MIVKESKDSCDLQISSKKDDPEIPNDEISVLEEEQII